MKRHAFSLLAGLLSLLYWTIESMFHWLFFGDEYLEWIPRDHNELWMRLVTVAVILLFGWYVDRQWFRLRKKDREKEEVYRAMLYSTHHILNNFLNQMRIIKVEAEGCADFNQQVLGYYDSIEAEAQELIARLEKVEDLSREGILASIKPK